MCGSDPRQRVTRSERACRILAPCKKISFASDSIRATADCIEVVPLGLGSSLGGCNSALATSVPELPELVFSEAPERAVGAEAYRMSITTSYISPVAFGVNAAWPGSVTA